MRHQRPRCQATSTNIQFSGGAGSNLPLSIHTVAMTIQRQDIMHTAFAYRWFFWKFTFFLIFPYRPGTATGHYAGFTVVDTYQFWAPLSIVCKATNPPIRIGNSHLIFTSSVYVNRSCPMVKTWETGSSDSWYRPGMITEIPVGQPGLIERWG